MTRLATVLALAACLVLGCSPKVDVAEPSPFEEDDPAAMPAARSSSEPATPAAIAPSPVARERRRHFEVSRVTLNQVLDGGPAPLLRGVELKPSFRDQAFNGWEIVQFMRGETRFDHIDLMPGDIVGRINRVVLARPDHLGQLWAELRSASSITIEVERGGEGFELRFDVLDDAQPTSP